MSDHRQRQSYSFCGIELQVSCSALISACLDSRFRLLPGGERYTKKVVFDFQAAPAAGGHAIERPQGNARPFYKMASGDAEYFEETDEVYLRYKDGVRALYQPWLNRVSVSCVESEPRNVFMASHLLLTILLAEVFKRHGWYSLHAAGFSESGKTVLIPGTSGAGKSTLALALLRGGFEYLGDDMIFLGRRPEGVAARGIVEDVDVSDETIRFFPELHFLLRTPKAEGFAKRQVRVDQVYGARIAPESRPAAIVLPRISGKRSSGVTEMDGGEALLEILPNVLRTQSRACQAHLGVLADTVKQAACYRLETGQDFGAIPALFREILCSHNEQVCA